MMFGYPFGGTRAALLIETKDENGNKHVMVYNLAMPLTVSLDYDIASRYNIFDGFDHKNQVPMSTNIHIDATLTDPPREWQGSMPETQEELEDQKAIESSEEIVVEGELIDEEIDYEWAFWDSDPNGLRGIIEYVYGIPIPSYDAAKHAGDKNVFGQTIVGRRPRGSDQEWEVVTHG